MKYIQHLKSSSFLIAAICFPGIFALLSCDKEDKYTISTPKIEAAQISPTTFNFGENVTLTAKISDSDANLGSLDIEIFAGDRLIAGQSIVIGGTEADVSQPVFIPLVPNLQNGTGVKIRLKAKNMLKGESETEITGLTGNRPSFNELFLVVDDHAYPLTRQASGDRFKVDNLTLNRAFNYRIAQKVSGNQIDYSGLVWGNRNGKLSLIDEGGEAAFAFAEGVDYTQAFTFDDMAFNVTLDGSNYGATDIVLSTFGEETIDGEVFRTLKRNLVKGEEYLLFNELADNEIVYNLDFFERTAVNKVKFLGETGSYTMYYNTYRKNMVVGVENPAYPDYILVTGGGLGYPTKVPDIPKEHTWWGFGNVRNFILFRKISDNVFQGTFMIHAKDDSWVGLKPFEDVNWGGEKRYDAFTFTGVTAFESPDGGDWKPVESIDPDACYRITINWATNVVNVEKINL
ncbi:MAG: hypothetical protein LBE91_14855 [Tannerella sp.]|jgi:hypothetical protein|nr:hypothetical protein [Tannerella sp.]